MGRPKGSPNKQDITLRAYLRQKGLDPVDVLVKLADSSDPEMQFKAANALLPYTHAKLSSIEIKGNLDTTSSIGIEPGAVHAIAKIIAGRNK